jgi:hypothetical protein
VAVNSIRTAVQVRHIAGDHLLVASSQVPFGKVNGVGKFNNLAKEVWPRAEALDDAGYLLSSGTGTPEIVSGGGLADRITIFCYANLGQLSGLFWLLLTHFGIVFPNARGY